MLHSIRDILQVNLFSIFRYRYCCRISSYSSVGSGGQ